MAGDAGRPLALAKAIEAAALSMRSSPRVRSRSSPWTDEAFQKLAGTIESLLKPENKEKSASILKFHDSARPIPTGRQAR